MFSQATPVTISNLVNSVYLLPVVSGPAGRIEALVTALSIIFFPSAGTSQGTCQQLHTKKQANNASFEPNQVGLCQSGAEGQTRAWTT